MAPLLWMVSASFMPPAGDRGPLRWLPSAPTLEHTGRLRTHNFGRLLNSVIVASATTGSRCS
jgi:ABC-type glycerol-3-phosphate transport system permease component